VHLVVDQVMQLQHVHVADRDRTLESIAGAAVIQRDLGFARRETQLLGMRVIARVSQIQHLPDFDFRRTVKHRGRKRHTLAQVARHFHDFLILQRIEVDRLAVGVVDLVQHLAHFGDLGLRLDHFTDADAKTFGRPAQVGFEDLTNVHP
jgi:hypothetical protein